MPSRRGFLKGGAIAGIAAGMGVLGGLEPVLASSSPQPEQTRGKIWYYNAFDRLGLYGWSTEREPKYRVFEGNTFEAWGSERFPEVTAEKGRSYGPAFANRCLELTGKNPFNYPASLSQYIAAPPSLLGVGMEIWFYLPRKTDISEFIMASNLMDSSGDAHTIAVRLYYDGVTWRLQYENANGWNDVNISSVAVDESVNRRWEMIRIIADPDPSVNRYRYIQFMGQKYDLTTAPLAYAATTHRGWNHYLQISSRTGKWASILLANYCLSYGEV